MRNQVSKVRLAICILVLFSAASAFGQDSAPSPSEVRPSGDEAGSTPPEGESAASSPRGEVEEILVRGQAQSGFRLEAESSSVTEFGSEDLTALGIEDVADLAEFTPNLEIVQASSTTATFFIRGVGLQDFSASATGAVAVYQDDVPMNSPPLQVSQIFDASNVGIVKGPQGSGTGRNASAGAIKILSNKPDLAGYTAKLSMRLGQIVSDDAPSEMLQDWQGVIGFPLVPDLAGARFAFRLTDVDPFITNRCGNQPSLVLLNPDGTPALTPGGRVILNPDRAVQCRSSAVPVGLPELVGNRHNWGARGQVRVVPDWLTDVEILFNAHGSRRDQQGTFGQPIGVASGGANFGGLTNGLVSGTTFYQQVDQQQERTELAASFVAQGLTPQQANIEATRQYGQILGSRPLDRRPYDGDYNKVGRQVLDTWGGFVFTNVNLDNVEIKVHTAFDGYERLSDNDTDMTPTLMFELTSKDEAWQFFQDLEIQGELPSHPFMWNFGAYFLKEKIDGSVETRLGGTNQRGFREYQQKLSSVGVYAGFEWEFLDDLTLTAGVRYNYEHKGLDLNQREIPDTVIPPADPFERDENGNLVFRPSCGFFPCPNPDPGRKLRRSASEAVTWEAPTGTVELLYRFSDEASAYLKYNRGWKSGHFNTNGAECPPERFNPADPAFCAPPGDALRDYVDPEAIDAFETGFTVSGWDNRISVQGALFHYDYENYQIFIFEQDADAAPNLQIINADDARVLGAELDMTFEPLVDFVPPSYQGLRIDLRGGWLNSEFLDFKYDRATNSGAGPLNYTTNNTGNPLPNSARFQASGSIQWSVEMGQYGTITPRYDFAWTDDVYFDGTKGVGATKLITPQFPEYTIGMPAHATHHLRLSYATSDGKMEVSGWCQNLTDQRIKNYAVDVTDFQSLILNFVADPRTCGGEVSLSW